MKKRLFSPLLAAALAAAVALTAAALPAFADGGEETPITIGQSQEQQAECTCTALCTGDSVNADCPVCGAEEADLTACKGLEAQPATLSNALPVTALAAAPSGQVLYVGGVLISTAGYWTTDGDGNVTAYTGGDTPTDNYIHYSADTNTLTLRNATIKKQLDYSENIEGGTYIFGSAIGVFNQNGAAELTITLEGANTIAEVGKGIFVLASSTSTGGATLNITGDGSLDASASQTGIWVQSNSNNAALCVKNAEVTASADGAFKNGVLVQAKEGSDVSLTVNGGSLTASVNANIWFQFGSGASGSGTPTVTVSNNAIVRANGGIANNSSSPIQYETGSDSTGGIVFDGKNGTVYGSVTLQEDLTIGEGESLTLDDGASLDTGNYTLTVNGGTLTDDVTGTVNYKVTGVSLDKTRLNLNVGVGATLTPTITPSNATDKSVTWESSAPGVATVDTNGKVTAVAEGTATITVTTADGGKTATCEVTVTPPAKTPVTSVTLDKTRLTLDVGGSDTLTATVKPDDATNKAVTWSTSNEKVATVNNGVVTAVGAGTATITAAASDGSGKTATCTVTVNGPVLPPQPSDPAPSQPTGTGGSSTNSAAPRQQGPVVHNVSNSSAYRKGEYEFWMKVRTKIVSAGPGEVIEVNARDNDKMPNSVMQALAAKEDVTLRIRWSDGEEIVIPSAAALQEKMRMFYPLSYLAKFDFAQTPAKKVK